MEEESQIIPFYDGKTIFITGVSGFVGKVLLEKLLYTCPKLERIYVLVRSKKGKAMEARLEEMYALPVFKRIRSECPIAFKKVVPLSGDVSVPNLGLSAADESTLIEELDIVIHGAASVSFKAKLSEMVNRNTAGTMRVVELCKKIKHLQLLVHISTAFCHCDMDVLEEQTYPPHYDPMDIIHLTNWLPEDMLEKITPDLLKPHPNTYTFSKRLAEAVIASNYPELPSCILRPSIVIPTWKEPIPGWVDNTNGPAGVLIGGGKGVIRTMHCDGNCTAEVIPVDMAVNGILIAIVHFAGSSSNRSNGVPVLNLTQGDTHKFCWQDVIDKGRKWVEMYPFEKMLWYPGGFMTKVKLYHDIRALLFHWLPAYAIDFLLWIFGQKTFMRRVQSKIHSGLQALDYFANRQWKFKNDKLLNIRSALNSHDKEKFYLDFENVDMDEFLHLSMLGCREYVMKEDPSSIPRSRVLYKILYYLDKIASATFYILHGWLIVSCSDTAASALDAAVLAFKSLLPFNRVLEEEYKIEEKL